MLNLTDFRNWLDNESQPVIEQRLASFQKLHNQPEIAEFSHHMLRLVKGGKRIRPYICALAIESTAPGTYKDYLNTFIGLELFHVFCLIHDDIIDQSKLRRGEQSLHTFVQEHVHPDSGRETRVKTVSEGQAMLLGDLLFSWAMADLYSNGAAQDEVTQMITEVVAGQMIDVQTTLKNQADQDTIERKIYYKTASYTFVRPFRIGLALAGVNEPERATLSAFAKPLGVGFQIQDDYLDLTGDSATTGKPTMSDVREGQHTLFSSHILASEDAELVSQFKKLFGNSHSTEADLLELQQRLISSNILLEGQRAFESQFDDAEKQITESTLSLETQTVLLALLTKIRTRSS